MSTLIQQEQLEHLAPGARSGECPVCRHSTEVNDGLLQMEQGLRVCAFCAVYFMSDREVPNIAVSDEANLLRAWNWFQDQLEQYVSNVEALYRGAKWEQEQLMRPALTQWLRGSLAGSEIQLQMMDSVWTVAALERILTLLEDSICAVEGFRCNKPPAELAATIEKPSIQRVWKLFLLASAGKWKISCIEG